MPIIELETRIKADINICFDLSTSIDLHQLSTSKTNEKAIDGRTSGLITLNEFVTWEAVHFGVKQKLTSKITAYNRPFHFRDEQLKGAFKYIIHDHTFEIMNDEVLMKDIFRYRAPFGIMGKLAEKIILTHYMAKLLTERNNIIKEYAESVKWKSVLNAGQ
jgi:ligand-binding SRPBCC domain-containing protein